MRSKPCRTPHSVFRARWINAASTFRCISSAHNSYRPISFSLFEKKGLRIDVILIVNGGQPYVFFTTFVLSLQICAAKIAKNQTYRYTYIYKGVTQTAIKGQKTEKLTKQAAFFHVFLPFFHFYLWRNLSTLRLISTISEEERKLTFSIPKKRWKSRWKTSG